MATGPRLRRERPSLARHRPLLLLATAALPSAQQRAATMAPVYAEIEATIRNGKPEEAAAARQQLAALQAAQGGSGVVWATHLTERWTRTNDSCPPGS